MRKEGDIGAPMENLGKHLPKAAREMRLTAMSKPCRETSEDCRRSCLASNGRLSRLGLLQFVQFPLQQRTPPFSTMISTAAGGLRPTWEENPTGPVLAGLNAQGEIWPIESTHWSALHRQFTSAHHGRSPECHINL